MGIFSKLFGGRPEDEQAGGQTTGGQGSEAAPSEGVEEAKERSASAKDQSSAAPRAVSPERRSGSPPPVPSSRSKKEASEDRRSKTTQVGPSFAPPGRKSGSPPKLSVAKPPPPPSDPKTSSSPSHKPVQAPHSKPMSAAPVVASKTPPPRGRAQELKAKQERERKPDLLPSFVNGTNGSRRSPLSTGKIESRIFDDISGETNAAFDAIESDGRGPSGPATLTYDAGTRQEVNKLFGEVAATHARQIRNFMIELSLDETTKQWAELCRPAIAALEKAADGMELDHVVKALRDFREALNHACAMPGARIAGDSRDLLLSRYKKLAQELPDTFKLEDDRDRREPIIVHTLLAQIPSVHKVTVDKLYSAGVVSLDALLGVSAGDLAAVAGISRDLAEAIVERVGQYREARAERVADPTDDASRSYLRSAVDKLRKEHERFCSADEDDDRRLKREVRRARNNLLHEINLLLAQIGEVDMVHDLERAPFESKIERLSSYLRGIPRAAHG